MSRITDLHVKAAKLSLAKYSIPTPADAAIRDMLAAAASLDAPVRSEWPHRDARIRNVLSQTKEE